MNYQQLFDHTTKKSLFAVSCFGIFASSSTPALAETQEIVAGPEYDRSGLHNFWWGKNYRELWTTPIEVEVLDLGKEAGGLTPEFEVGGLQTPGLALKGADGKSYTFRSVNKDATGMLPYEWRQTVVAKQVQDQISASHPGVFPVMNGLAEALPWAVEPPQRLVIMPDDPRLGEFREKFAGVLGTFGVFPTPTKGRLRGYKGATEVLSSRELWSRWLDDQGMRINAELFLRYRIIDIWTGNWDRHSKQWRWANVPGEPGWRPIAEDPDQAFADYQGPLLWLARWHYPKLLAFKDEISKMEGVAFNGADIDRWLLTELERDTFLELAREVQGQLTDEVIDNAVKRLPPEWYAINGQALTARLKSRRHNLVEGIDRYYRHLAAQVSIRGTDRDDRLHIRRFEDGAVEVDLAPADRDSQPYYRRRFDPKETKALHIYLYGGNDQVVTEGPPKGRIKIHVVGGPGDDTLDDSRGGRTRFYDFEGQNDVVKGKGTKVDTRPYENPSPSEDNPWLEPRDFGSWTRPEVRIGYNSDLELLLGAGFTRTSWSFRKFPNDNNHHLMATYSTGRSSGALDYIGTFNQINSKWSYGAWFRASGIEKVNFFGFGNETVRVDELDDRDFYEVEEDLIRFVPTINYKPDKRTELFFGPEFQYTEESSSDTLIAEQQPYGSGDFGQFGLLLGGTWDSRGLKQPSESLARFDLPKAEQVKPERRTGIRAQAIASYYPEVWDLVTDFGALEAELRGNLALGKRERVVLAGRVGGRKVWGTFPWREAAFIGGQDSNRGFALQRFGGDESLYGGVEFRWHLFNAVYVFPGRLWIYGLADAGRVWVDGEDSDEWHPSYGGGVVIELAATPMKFRVEVAKNDDEDETKFYLASGFAF